MPEHARISVRTRHLIAAGAACFALANGAAEADVLAIKPIDFGAGMVATGTLTTSGGAITDWNLAVTTTTTLAQYTPANSGSKTVNLVSVSANGQQLTVSTSPDSLNYLDGGALGFRSPNVFQDVGVTLADFTALVSPGGEAQYMAGGVFDVTLLNQPDNIEYLAGTHAAGGGNVFQIKPLAFSGGVTLTGTLTTDGTIGTLSAANIVDWNITAQQVTTDVFDASNSTLNAFGTQISADGRHVTVDVPDGYLEFDKGPLGARKYALSLADFTTNPGTAGYYQGRLAVTTVDLAAGGASYEVTAPVPLPAAFWLLAPALAGLGFARRK
jgi:hypothetical protein